jgi:hypothetical protein
MSHKFASGSISFRRVLVVGDPGHLDGILEALRANKFQGQELGVPEEVVYGWSGGAHIHDVEFTFEANVFNDFVLFALRVDTAKAPPELKRAYTAAEEAAAARSNPSGFLSKTQKREVRELVRQRLEDELKAGKHRRSRLVPVAWDTARRVLYTPAANADAEKLLELWERTFGDGCKLLPLSAGADALRDAESRGKRRDHEDARPTRFARGPQGDGQYPEYPWIAKGPEPKDFFGNEFLLWLWREAEQGTLGDTTVFFDRGLELECAYGQTGRDTFRAEGPTRMSEARDALRQGKVPRRAGLILDTGAGEQFTFTLAAETLALSGVQLPKPETAETPREAVEMRLTSLTNLVLVLDDLYQAFLCQRLSGDWPRWTAATRRWIESSAATKAGAA